MDSSSPARSSSDLLPHAFYQPAAELPALARMQVARAGLQRALQKELSVEASRRVATELLNTDVRYDARVARDERNVSTFYKAVSAAAIVGAPGHVRDIAFGRRTAARRYVHGLTFTGFLLNPWPEGTVIVPHNVLNERDAAMHADVLAQLEPVSSVRRDVRAAAAALGSALPEALQQYAARGDVSPDGYLAAPLTDRGTLFGVPDTVLFYVAHRELDDALAREMAAWLARVRTLTDEPPSILTHYIADAALPDEPSGPVIQHDILFRVKRLTSP